MEPERPTGTPIEMPIETSTRTPVNNNKQDIFKITTLVTAIIAICGISFGVYGIIQSS